jgi:hypothetical protein
MKTHRLECFFCIALAAVLVCDVGIAWSAGTDAGLILSRNLSSAAAGMGEACTARQGELYCLHYNPAGIAILSQSEISCTYERGVGDENVGVLDLGIPCGGCVVALGTTYLSTGEIEMLDTFGNARSVVGQEDFVFTFGVGGEVMPGLCLGSSFKILHSALVEEFSGSAVVLDFGVQYARELSNKSDETSKVISAIVAQNLGSGIKYRDITEPLPVTLRYGLAYQKIYYTEHAVTLAADFVYVKDDLTVQKNIGLEYQYHKMISCRAGYKLDSDLNELSVGAGVQFSPVTFDYAANFMGVLGLAHHVSLSIRL